MNRTHTLLAIVLYVTVLGCDTVDGPAIQPRSPKQKAVREEVFRLNISVNEPGKDTVTNRLTNPSQELLRQQFDAIDWSDTEKRTSIVLQTPTGSDTIGVKRLRESGNLIATWSEQKDGRWRHMIYDPVSETEAFDLLSSLLAQDNRHSTLVEWKDGDDE